MIKRVKVYTFELGRNQGSCVELGIHDLDVYVRYQQVSVRNGCISEELVLREVATVCIDTSEPHCGPVGKYRTFILEPHDLPLYDYELAIPQELSHLFKDREKSMSGKTVKVEFDGKTYEAVIK